MVLHITVGGLYWKPTDKLLPFWIIFSLLSPQSVFSIRSHRHNHQCGTGCDQMHIENTAPCAQCPDCAHGQTHGDPPLADLCFFHFISLQSSWLCDYQAIVFWQTTGHQLSTSPPHHHSDQNNVRLTYVADIAQSTWVYICLWLITYFFKMGTRLVGVRVNTQRPCSQAESPLTQTFLLLCFFAALPSGLSTLHTPHTRLSKRRMWRNM